MAVAAAAAVKMRVSNAEVSSRGSGDLRRLSDAVIPRKLRSALIEALRSIAVSELFEERRQEKLSVGAEGIGRSEGSMRDSSSDSAKVGISS